MNELVRKHVERALRVAAFARQFPSDLPGHIDALARLEAELGRVAEAAQSESGNRREVRRAIAERLELRAQLTAEMQMLAGIARTAGKESVGTPIVLRYPGPQRSQLQFLNDAREIVTRARTEEALLLRYGLPAGSLDGLTTGLDRFESLMGKRDTAVRAHVGARVEIKALARDVKSVVDQMHTINRFRFRQDPATMAMWQAARALRVGNRKPAEGGQATSAPLALPPGMTDLKPAA